MRFSCRITIKPKRGTVVRSVPSVAISKRSEELLAHA